MSELEIPQWLVNEFERGYRPGDEPGFEEQAYARWKASRGNPPEPRYVTITHPSGDRTWLLFGIRTVAVFVGPEHVVEAGDVAEMLNEELEATYVPVPSSLGEEECRDFHGDFEEEP